MARAVRNILGTFFLLASSVSFADTYSFVLKCRTVLDLATYEDFPDANMSLALGRRVKHLIDGVIPATTTVQLNDVFVSVKDPEKKILDVNVGNKSFLVTAQSESEYKYIDFRFECKIRVPLPSKKLDKDKNQKR